MQTPFIRPFAALCAALVAGATLPLHQDRNDAPAAKATYPRTIVVVRHAEKAEEPKEDPILTDQGTARAQRLAALLRKSGVTHLYASDVRRTQLTLAPLAEVTGLAVQAIARPGALAAVLDKLPRGALAVVAGHSNTVPGLVARLTGEKSKVTIAEGESDRVFLVTQWGPGTDACVVELGY